MKGAFIKHRTLFAVVLLGFIIFINCCGFPVYNLTKEFSAEITVVSVYIVLVGSCSVGIALAMIFSEKTYGFMASVTAIFSCVGLLCRYLLEFGEASNPYNFTAPNILLHLGAFVLFSSLGWLYAVKKLSGNTIHGE